MGVLIDASILIDHERGRLDLADWAEGREDEPFRISVITASELLHGVHRAGDPGRRARRRIFVEAILDRFPTLPVDRPVARVHAELWADLASRGVRVGPHDLWMAATAMAHGLSLATSNLREFRRIEGLEVEDWSEPRPPAD